MCTCDDAGTQAPSRLNSASDRRQDSGARASSITPGPTEGRVTSHQLRARGREPSLLLLRKEVIQPHVPVRLPCYDFTPVIELTLDTTVNVMALGTPDSHGVTGGVYKARERIQRGVLIHVY